VTTTAIHTNVIAGETPTLSPIAPASSSGLDRQHELGQFLTPNPVAEFMASLVEIHRSEVRLLDAGAGAGALSAALVGRLCREPRKPKRISLTAYEIDAAQIEPLRARLDDCRSECERAGISFSATVLNEDFIAAAVPLVRGDLFASESPRFNTAIINPPYRKIRSDSSTRLLLRSAGIETSNLYAGFVALVTRLLERSGELVAITPRSFCNGPYFKPFREDLLEAMSLRRLHVFESRSAAFSGDAVLQENIIFHAVKGAPKPKHVIISSSSGASGDPVAERAVEYREVVSPDDAEQFIHLVEGGTQDNARAVMGRLSASLPTLGLSVSTGRVVDFRAKEFLRQQPGRDTAPLIYPCHFNGGFVHWPKEKAPRGADVFARRRVSMSRSAPTSSTRGLNCRHAASNPPKPAAGSSTVLGFTDITHFAINFAMASGVATCPSCLVSRCHDSTDATKSAPPVAISTAFGS
jgi:adenine-specific DNA-methyltransferase